MTTAQTATPTPPSQTHERTYLALVYQHPRGIYIAECPAFPIVEGQGASADDALATLVREVAVYLADVASGAEPTPTGNNENVVLSSITVSASDGVAHTYTAIITQDDGSYPAVCPAIGTASQGDTVAESLAMLTEATTLYLEDQLAPTQDVEVLVERIAVPTPDALTSAGASEAK